MPRTRAGRRCWPPPPKATPVRAPLLAPVQGVPLSPAPAQASSSSPPSPASHAALLRCAAATVWLLHRGASVGAEKQDQWHDTCLHYAAGRGSLETVQALLAWGADPAAQNALGERGGAAIWLPRDIWLPSSDAAVPRPASIPPDDTLLAAAACRRQRRRRGQQARPPRSGPLPAGGCRRAHARRAAQPGSARSALPGQQGRQPSSGWRQLSSRQRQRSRGHAGKARRIAAPGGGRGGENRRGSWRACWQRRIAGGAGGGAQAGAARLRGLGHAR